jgi:hypothetical protein
MTSAITRLKLLGDCADELTKWQADVELREAERERSREPKPQPPAQQQLTFASAEAEAAYWSNWQKWLDSPSNASGTVGRCGGGSNRHRTRIQHDKIRAEVEALGREIAETTTKLHERLARLPLVKTWEDRVHYVRDVVVDGGGIYQARCDTGRPVTSDDWICLARHGVDGRSPNFRGGFNANETYRALDVVEFDGSSFFALYNDPGIPGEEDGWQLVARHGHRGPVGETGPRGRIGERGARGEDAPTIINWTIDTTHYRAVPTMSDGRAGAPLELRGLFKQFLLETQGME